MNPFSLVRYAVKMEYPVSPTELAVGTRANGRTVRENLLWGAVVLRFASQPSNLRREMKSYLVSLASVRHESLRDRHRHRSKDKHEDVRCRLPLQYASHGVIFFSRGMTTRRTCADKHRLLFGIFIVFLRQRSFTLAAALSILFATSISDVLEDFFEFLTPDSDADGF